MITWRQGWLYVFTMWTIGAILVVGIVLFGWPLYLMFVVPFFGTPPLVFTIHFLDEAYKKRHVVRDERPTPPAHFAAVPRNR